MPSEPSSRRRRRGRGSPADPQTAHRRGSLADPHRRGSPADPQAGSYAWRSYAPTSVTQDWPYAPVFTPLSAPVFAPKSAHAPPPTPYAHFSKMIDKYFPDSPRPAYTSYSPTSQPPLAHTVQKLDVLSLEDSNNGPHLSWSPIWDRSVFDWGITFYTTRDRTGSFRTYPDVGGPFQSLDQVNSAIDQYLIDHEDPTMCVGLSQVDSIVKRVRYYPDGTKKRGSEVKDKRRDKYYQLARLLVDKYNDHHNLFGDLAYEVKDFLHGKPLWEDYYIHWTYFHMNFIAKAKGSYGVDIGNLFFAEVKYMRGDDGLTVNSCCILEPSDDHGLCYGCGADMKHPNDGNTYACGRRNISYHFQNGAPELPPGYCNDRYYEDSDEEVERLRSQFKKMLSP
ncbi:uncharacterized protein LOC123439093 isoform X1 [Hordeum vulgare subsp. vulgare]|uniref:uncharacterized protein LOC123439093 isoform X1 n=1 Tax=Hordeum vulgare subsp. vulgare TaxID=112509 RepID=UPI001D1A35AE|nr:uncharacterized protein LOC123439093 isoform X1 [Hordeum vulgare subsp. vulgare]